MMRALTVVRTAAVISALRRLAHRTGVTDDEAFRSLAGDDVIPRPMFEYNRGLTIAATPADIWPG